MKVGAFTEAVWSPLNSVQKFYFVFTSSGLFKSGALKTLLDLWWSGCLEKDKKALSFEKLS